MVKEVTSRGVAALRSLLVAVALVALVAPAGAQSVAEYRLGPRDLLDIRVLEAPELNGERRVSDAGTISLPLLGEVQVTGLSSGELRDRLAAELTAKFVNRANVSVVVKEYANKPITVIGAVGRAGNLNVSGNYSLLQVLSAAGGVSGSAGRKIYVLRIGESGLTDTLEISTTALIEGSDPKWNVPIVPSDVINVPPRSTVRIFCIGEVRSPGEITFDSDSRITLLAAIAKAGGLTDRASSRIVIRRKHADGRDEELEVNFKRVLSGDVPDPELRSDDMIVVRESFF
jgi:polysaccharide biosynthesis/export protein